MNTISPRFHNISQLNGLIVACVTPMRDDDDTRSLDLTSLERLVKWHIAQGTQGIVACGTTGESPTLTPEEWESVVLTCIKSAEGKIPIIAGTGTNSTRTTILRTEAAYKLGVDAALIVTPYYNKPTQEGLYEHFSAVSNAVPQLPIILYNVPGRTGCDILPETVARLAKAPGIVGIKESSGKVERFTELSAACGPNFKLYSGEDGNVVESILHGGHGVISVAGNVVPEQMQRMCKLALEGNVQEATKLKERLSGLTVNLFKESNPIPVKWLLADQKRIPGGIRLPLLPHSGKFHCALRKAYDEGSRD